MLQNRAFRVGSLAAPAAPYALLEWTPVASAGCPLPVHQQGRSGPNPPGKQDGGLPSATPSVPVLCW